MIFTLTFLMVGSMLYHGYKIAEKNAELTVSLAEAEVLSSFLSRTFESNDPMNIGGRKATLETLIELGKHNLLADKHLSTPAKVKLLFSLSQTAIGADNFDVSADLLSEPALRDIVNSTPELKVALGISLRRSQNPERKKQAKAELLAVAELSLFMNRPVYGAQAYAYLAIGEFESNEMSELNEYIGRADAILEQVNFDGPEQDARAFVSA